MHAEVVFMCLIPYPVLRVGSVARPFDTIVVISIKWQLTLHAQMFKLVSYKKAGGVVFRTLGN